MLRVLFLVTAFPRHPADVITPWMMETIRQLRRVGVSVEVLAPSYQGMADQVLEGVPVHRFRYAPRHWETLTHDQTAPDRLRERPAYLGLVPGYVLAGSRAAARLARSGRFDVLHAFWPLPHGLLGWVAKRASGVPLVSTFFGVELTWMRRQLPMLRPVARAILRGSDEVTAISDWTAGLVREVLPTAAPTVIPFGAALELPDRLARRPRPPDEPLQLLFLGRLVERKGVHVLLEALAQLGRPARLDVVGDGPERVALERRAATLGLGERVRFHGFVSAEEKRRLLERSDALVLPAIVDAKGDVEGLGVVLLEAFAFGTPVVASAAGGITDIVAHGRNGLLVPPGDVPALAEALRTLHDAPELGLRLGEAGRLDVERRFSWTSITTRLVELYRRVSTRAQER